ncbi:MAG: type II toxin-antitoxin system VapB family antitoxin [Bosea sp. (in: a-proteobacteria)]
MSFHIRDPRTDKAVRELAALKGTSLTEAIRVAAENELDRARRAESERDKRPFTERIKDIQDRVAARGKSGLKADKAFYDSLYED